MATLRCDECGAAARTTEDRFCAFCGAAYVVPASPRDDEHAHLERRFELLENHPEAKAALRARVSGAQTVARHGAGALFMVFFAVVAGAVAVFMIGGANQVQQGFESSPGFPGGSGFPGGPPPGASSTFFSLFKIIPLLVVGIGVVFAIKALMKTARVATAPTRAGLGHVLDEHTETRGSNDHVRTVHVVTLESPSGRRESYEIPRTLARSLTRGDMGVAHTKGGELVRFTRIDV